MDNFFFFKLNHNERDHVGSVSAIVTGLGLLDRVFQKATGSIDVFVPLILSLCILNSLD